MKKFKDIKPIYQCMLIAFGWLLVLFGLMILLVGFDMYMLLLIVFGLIYVFIVLYLTNKMIKFDNRPNKFTMKMFLCADRRCLEDGLVYYHLSQTPPYKKIIDANDLESGETFEETAENHWFCDTPWMFTFTDKACIPQRYKKLSWFDDPVLVELEITNIEHKNEIWFIENSQKEYAETYRRYVGISG